MIETMVKYNNINVYFYEYINSGLYINENKCPICKKLLSKNELLYLIEMEGKTFSGISIHKNCVLNKEDCITFLIQEWKKFEENIFFRNRGWV